MTTVDRSVITVLVWLAVVIGGGAAGAVVFDRLSSATDPAASSESQQARRLAEAATGEHDTVIALLTDVPADATRQATARLRDVAGVHRVRSSADGQLPPPDGGGTLLAIGLSADLDDGAANAAVDAVRAALEPLGADRVLLGGYPVVDRELGATAEADLVTAEAIALPIVLILLGLAVRSAVGTAIGATLVVTTVAGALALLLGVSAVTEVSSFAINVVTMFGMGLAVDYGLLVITRFRRERGANGTDVAAAVAVTMATAGRTVAFSGLTVAVALAGLLAFAEPIARSMAYGGIGAVAVAVAATLTLLPVLLRRLGHRIPPAAGTTAGGGGTAGGGFGRLARLVQRRPAWVAAATLAVLVGLAAPLLGLRLEGLDARALPADSVARRDSLELERRLPALARTPITVVAAVDAGDPRLPGYLDRLRGLDHVATASVRPGTIRPGAGHTLVDVTVDGPAAGRDAMAVVEAIRAHRPDFEVKVGGLAATDRDFIASLLHRAPYAAAIIAVATFLVLLAVTGGVLVAAKAVAMNLASLAASLGVLVWIFQDGHLAGLLGFTPTGGLELLIVVLAAVFAFGLSTDYEVFLLSSVMAARHEGHGTDTAVAIGIARTGRIITTAALLIVVVFAGFAAGDLLIIKQLGVGLAVAVLLDASLVRLLLTPALMTLLGRGNWAGPGWASRTSRRLWRHEDTAVIGRGHTGVAGAGNAARAPRVGNPATGEWTTGRHGDPR